MFNIIVLHLLGMMSPGPDFFFIMRTAAQQGRTHALWAVAGIVTGVMFWACATMLGLAVLFRHFPAVESVLMCLGGGYLMYLGWKMARVRDSISFADMDAVAVPSEKQPQRLAKKALLVNLSNPKIAVYFGSVMSAVLADIQETWQFAGVLLLILTETVLYFSAVALLFSGGAVKRFYSRYSRLLDNLSGLFFLGFGVYLIYRAVF
ncbi:hypothetical protein BG910_10820 [Neisseria chenwenguii]|uniref:Uncharacterized protein n=1 Tax=Neisseria chenwenguii TaxID=1853278 RepID=A0A220S5E3_9NEIS|nr:hypothetical protein BG910_10820 [Neisseria chenwenguii]ROV57431.1 hypothetical protein EGS38_01090 [Neisseria chenwenguii]